MNIDVAIMTRSSKHGGYCVAGIDMKNGNWVRLTSNDEESHGALFADDIRYENGRLCEPLDIVRVELIGNNPSQYQPENMLIDNSYFWVKKGECTIHDILRIHPSEQHDLILGNRYEYIRENSIGEVGHSLVLVKVSNLVLRVVNSFGSLKTKADFSYNSIEYNFFSVTDPNYFRLPNTITLKKAILVMSLPDSPYPEDKYYKFIAQIFEI